MFRKILLHNSDKLCRNYPFRSTRQNTSGGIVHSENISPFPSYMEYHLFHRLIAVATYFHQSTPAVHLVHRRSQQLSPAQSQLKQQEQFSYASPHTRRCRIGGQARSLRFRGIRVPPFALHTHAWHGSAGSCPCPGSHAPVCTVAPAQTPQDHRRVLVVLLSIDWILPRVRLTQLAAIG